jgi:hypothetical protein
VDKKIKNADRTDLIPWRPKYFKAPPLILKCTLALFGLMMAYQFVAISSSTPVNGALAAVCLQVRVGRIALRSRNRSPSRAPVVHTARHFDTGVDSASRIALRTAQQDIGTCG